jgi:hypothetical protein
MSRVSSIKVTRSQNRLSYSSFLRTVSRLTLYCYNVERALIWLELAYPEIPLLPSDPYSRAQVRYAVDDVSKSILPPFYRLLQAQETEKRDEARQGRFLRSCVIFITY